MMLLGLILACLPLASSPEAEGVSSPKLMEWIDSCEREIDTLHGFVFLRHGKLVAEGSWKPFDTLNEPHFLSSHTKCFTATAIGFLVEDGNLDLDDRVIDILPDKALIGNAFALYVLHPILIQTFHILDLIPGGAASALIEWLAVVASSLLFAIVLRKAIPRTASLSFGGR